MRSYVREINCSIEAKLFYKDCENADSLRHVVKYLDDGPYPWYNCLIKKGNNSCYSNCTQLALSDYRLILVQKFNNKIEPAWTGLNKCNSEPHFRLTFNQTIDSCKSNNASKMKIKYLLVMILILLKIVFEKF